METVSHCEWLLNMLNIVHADVAADRQTADYSFCVRCGVGLDEKTIHTAGGLLYPDSSSWRSNCVGCQPDLRCLHSSDLQARQSEQLRKLKQAAPPGRQSVASSSSSSSSDAC